MIGTAVAWFRPQPVERPRPLNRCLRRWPSDRNLSNAPARSGRRDPLASLAPAELAAALLAPVAPLSAVVLAGSGRRRADCRLRRQSNSWRRSRQPDGPFQSHPMVAGRERVGPALPQVARRSRVRARHALPASERLRGRSVPGTGCARSQSGETARPRRACRTASCERAGRCGVSPRPLGTTTHDDRLTSRPLAERPKGERAPGSTAKQGPQRTPGTAFGRAKLFRSPSEIFDF
jgi:hypothetical protein